VVKIFSVLGEISARWRMPISCRHPRFALECAECAGRKCAERDVFLSTGHAALHPNQAHDFGEIGSNA
jgi:hypothetical protein